MGERLEYSQAVETAGVVDDVQLINGLGRMTILEALAEETMAVSPDMSRRSTRQGSADFEDD